MIGIILHSIYTIRKPKPERGAATDKLDTVNGQYVNSIEILSTGSGN